MNSIYAIHGFLGKTSDWDPFLNLSLIPVDPFKCSYPSTLWEFAAEFNNSITSNPHNILLGYSMGGRLALHALLHHQEKWKAAVIISTNPGLQRELEAKERLDKDLALLDRFLHQNFDHVMDEWNCQDLFKEDAASSFHRKKEDYTKEILSQSLKTWSLGSQDDLRESLSKLAMPILWIVGGNDKKYLDIAINLKFSNPKSRIWIAPNVSHRVPWALKKEFQEQVKTYIEGL